MVSILGNCYPERFKALASHDGSQFYSSYFGMDFTDIVMNGAAVPATVAAKYGNSCSVIAGRPAKMPIIIFHGMKSPLMSPVHAFQVESEFKIFNDYLDNGLKDNSYFLEKDVKNVTATTDVYGYNLFTTTNVDHEVLIERYMIDDLTHGWSGGLKDMLYNDPNGPDASALIFKFFQNYGL